MPRRIPLVLGLVIASATSVYAIRPVERSPNPYQIDMQAAEFCHEIAIGAVRGKQILQVVREKIKTVYSRDAERIVGMVVRTQAATDHLENFSVSCHTSWTENGVLLIDMDVRELPSFGRGGKKQTDQ